MSKPAVVSCHRVWVFKFSIVYFRGVRELVPLVHRTGEIGSDSLLIGAISVIRVVQHVIYITIFSVPPYTKVFCLAARD